MITDKTLDEALVELLRTKRALEALREVRKKTSQGLASARPEPWTRYEVDRECTKEHAAAKRATLDLTRKLADLRAGR